MVYSTVSYTIKKSKARTAVERMCGLSTVVTPAGASLTMYREIRSYANSIWDDNNNNNNIPDPSLHWACGEPLQSECFCAKVCPTSPLSLGSLLKHENSIVPKHASSKQPGVAVRQIQFRNTNSTFHFISSNSSSCCSKNIFHASTPLNMTSSV